jgi:hypothetical protein
MRNPEAIHYRGPMQEAEREGLWRPGMRCFSPLIERACPHPYYISLRVLRGNGPRSPMLPVLFSLTSLRISSSRIDIDHGSLRAG